MSLIVALTSGSRVQILSDSEVSHPDGSRSEVIPGRLKLVVLSPQLCVGYAGAVEPALDAIRTIPKAEDARSHLAGTLQHLLEGHQAAPAATDFIVVSAGPPPVLHKISEGRLSQGFERYWIGSADAVSIFGQGLAAALRTTNLTTEFATVGAAAMAFESLLNDGAVESVGGVPFSVILQNGALNYACAARAFFPTQSIPDSTPTALQFGTAAVGGFSYSVLTPLEPGHPIVGVYFLQGRFGYAYTPIHCDRPSLIENVSHAEFRTSVMRTYGVDVQGPILGS